MNINEAYEKYKHLDYLWSDKGWVDGDMKWSIIADLWGAIKEMVEGEDNDPRK